MRRHAGITSYCLEVWHEAGKLAPEQASIAQGKVESFMHSGSIISQSTYYTRIAHDHPAIVQHARHVVRQYLRCVS